MQFMISVDRVSKVYEDGTVALKDVSFEVEKGESCSIIGPSGCGKSTLLFIISGLLKATSGEVRIEGRKIDCPSKDVSLVLQDYGLFPWMNVYENVAFGLRVRKVKKDDEKVIVNRTLDELGIKNFEKHYPKQLSGGIRQRVAIARALATNPRILLMDEPFSSLDALNREKMQNLLLEIWKKSRITFVLVTHSIEEAVFLSRKIVVLSPRPGTVKKIIENNSAGEEEYRFSDEYFRKCREVRKSIEFGVI